MYHFNETIRNIKLVHDRSEYYYEFGRRLSRKIWLTKHRPILAVIDEKRYQFTLKVTALSYFSSSSPQYKLELGFEDNPYLNSLTEMTIYFKEQQTGYSFSLNYTNKSNNSLLASMEVYNTALPEQDIYIKAVLSYQKKKYIDNLQKNMKYILESQIYSDFKIIVGEKTFNVHKAIIAAESNVLLNLLEADMVEKKTGQVELQGQDPAVVEAALEYIYTKKCNISEKTTEIFKLAHFLELKDLQAECEDYLIHHVTVKNLMRILEITCLYKSELKKLRSAAIQFMKKNISVLINDDFANSLCGYLEIDTVTLIMQISAKCRNVDCAIEKITVYVREHYEELFKDYEFLRCLKAEPDLMIKMLKNDFDVMKIS